MKILGIHDGHNASVALLENSVITFALQEERPTNEKNFFGFPKKALEHLLKYKNLTPRNIDYVALSSHYISAPMTGKEVKQHFGWQGTPLAVVAKKISKLPLIQKIREKKSLKRRFLILEHLGFPAEKIKVLDHHLCHAAAAYHGLRESSDKKYLVLTLDGGGDWLCGTVNIAQNGKIKTITRIPYGHSLGDLYARTTYLMGFTPWEHEYKLMGMAPYSNLKHARKVAAVYKNYLDLDPQNPLSFKKKIFEDTNHILPRLERDLKRIRFDNITGGLQVFTEDLLIKWVRACIRKTGVSDLLLSGGVFMNIKANKVVSEMPEVKSIAAFPSCGDESNALGATWLLYHQITEGSGNPLPHYYLGPAFSNEEVLKALEEEVKENYFTFEKVSEINKVVAKLLADRKIVARASGPMEFGARALGNRSIFADPKNQKIVPIINSLIKSRDFWMPFAPIVLKEKSQKYLINPKNISSPYMMMGFDTTEAHEELVAAIHPADKSARPQILEKNQNPDVEEILNEFEKLTGRAILLNTSFNLHGYPIVFSPKEALWTFKNSGLEYLVMEEYLIKKNAK
ncbi:MAG: hypothetical protein KJI72_01715 [Patescibacteria group bacterium]|nr:hypothetical protein [Patescibacteria group bacterium]